MADQGVDALTLAVASSLTGAERWYLWDGATDMKLPLTVMRDWMKTQFTDNLEFVCDGGGSALTAKTYGYIEVPYACTLKQVTALADVSGSVVVEIWKTTFSSFDAGSTHPVTGDKLNASGTPTTLASATKNQDTTLASWTTALSAGDILAFHVNSATTITRVTVSLKVQRS